MKKINLDIEKIGEMNLRNILILAKHKNIYKKIYSIIKYDFDLKKISAYLYRS